MSQYLIELKRQAQKIILEKARKKKEIKERRTPDMPCLLCQKELATKKESHIIPRFLSKELFNEKGEIYETGTNVMDKKPRVHQSTPKVDYILCPSCEKYFSILETYIGNNPYQYLWKKERQEGFKITAVENRGSLVECVATDRTLFILFLYSIVWRAFVTNHPFFKAVYVNEQLTEDVRKSLCAYKSADLEKIKQSIAAKETLLRDSKFAIFTCEKFEDGTSNAITCLPGAKPYTFVLGKLWFVILFTIDDKNLSFLNNEVNSNNDPIKIMKFNEATWFKEIKASFLLNFTEHTSKELRKAKKGAFDIGEFMDERGLM